MLDELKKLFNINETIEVDFVEKYGFTFVFERKIIHINDLIASAEIKPLGIIYEENDEFYFAPLHARVDINVIVKEFVEKMLKK